MVNDPKNFPIYKNLDVLESILLSNPRSFGECMRPNNEPSPDQEANRLVHASTNTMAGVAALRDICPDDVEAIVRDEHLDFLGIDRLLLATLSSRDTNWRSRPTEYGLCYHRQRRLCGLNIAEPLHT